MHVQGTRDLPGFPCLTTVPDLIDTTTDATDVAYFPTLAFSSSNQFVTIISCDWAPGL